MPTLSGNDDRFQAGGWAASANVWDPGRYQNGKDFRQTITTADPTFPSGTRISWTWPYDSHRALTYENYPVRAYPNLLHGVDPWSGAPSTSAEFPARIDGIGNLDLSFDFGISGNTNLYNVAISLWISDDPAKGLQGVTDEVMIWLHNGYFTPAGEKVAEIPDPAGPATLWNKREFSGGVDTNPVDWEYTAVTYGQDRLAGTLDIDGLLRTLESRGIVDRTDWLLGIQVGPEVAAGTGAMDVKALSLAFAGPPPPPTTPPTTPIVPAPASPPPGPAGFVTMAPSHPIPPPTLGKE